MVRVCVCVLLASSVAALGVDDTEKRRSEEILRAVAAAATADYEGLQQMKFQKSATRTKITETIKTKECVAALLKALVQEQKALQNGLDVRINTDIEEGEDEINRTRVELKKAIRLAIQNVYKEIKRRYEKLSTHSTAMMDALQAEVKGRTENIVKGNTPEKLFESIMKHAAVQLNAKNLDDATVQQHLAEMMLADARKNAIKGSLKWAGSFSSAAPMRQKCADARANSGNDVHYAPFHPHYPDISTIEICNRMQNCDFERSQVTMTFAEDSYSATIDPFTGETVVGNYPDDTIETKLSCPGVPQCTQEERTRGWTNYSESCDTLSYSAKTRVKLQARVYDVPCSSIRSDLGPSMLNRGKRTPGWLPVAWAVEDEEDGVFHWVPDKYGNPTGLEHQVDHISDGGTKYHPETESADLHDAARAGRRMSVVLEYQMPDDYNNHHDIGMNMECENLGMEEMGACQQRKADLLDGVTHMFCADLKNVMKEEDEDYIRIENILLAAGVTDQDVDPGSNPMPVNDSTVDYNQTSIRFTGKSDYTDITRGNDHLGPMANIFNLQMTTLEKDNLERLQNEFIQWTVAKSKYHNVSTEKSAYDAATAMVDMKIKAVMGSKGSITTYEVELGGLEEDEMRKITDIKNEFESLAADWLQLATYHCCDIVQGNAIECSDATNHLIEPINSVFPHALKKPDVATDCTRRLL